MIRVAEERDVEELSALHIATWRAAYRGLMSDELLDGLDLDARVRKWRDNIAGQDPDSGPCTIVAHRDGELLGFGGWGPCRDDDADDGIGEIYAAYVRPDHWGSGVGYALMRKLLEHLSDKREAWLWVLRGNERASSFYERQGFSFDGAEKTAEFFGYPLDEVRMRRTI